MGCFFPLINFSQSVTNVQAKRVGGGILEITYNLDCSDPNIKTFFIELFLYQGEKLIQRINLCKGQIGSGIKAGTLKTINWNPILEGLNDKIENAIFKISAIPEQYNNMVLIYPKDYKNENGSIKLFYIQKKEVTYLEFSNFIVFSKYNTDSEKGKWSYTLKPDGTFESVLNINYNYNPRGVSLNPVFDSHKPVVFVSFNDAAEYAKFNQMRLPTEQEWELASLSGLKQEVNLAELDSTAWSFNELDKYSICQDVGLLKSNGLGLFDMFGNVSEWTIGSQILPGGERAEKEPIKGGSFVNKKNEINSKMSSLGARDFSYGDVGFRCVKDVKY